MTALVLGAGMAVPRSVAGAQGTRTGAIRGVVVIDDSSRAPVPLVDVYIRALARFARTDSAGQFFIGGLPNGSYELRARRLGFEPVVRQLAVNAADTVEYEVAMTPIAQLVSQVDVVAPAVPIRPELTPSEKKKRASMGRVILREELDDLEGRSLSDLLQRLPGLRIVWGRQHQAWVANSGNRGARGGGQQRLSPFDVRSGADPNFCYAQIIIDDVRVYSGRGDEVLFDINAVSAEIVEDLEWFQTNSLLPVQYPVIGSTCGALIVTLRRD